MMMTTAPLFRFAYTRPIVAGLAAGLILLAAEHAFSAPQAEPPEFLPSTHAQSNTCLASREDPVGAARPAGWMSALDGDGGYFLPRSGGQTCRRGDFMVARSDAPNRVKPRYKVPVARPDPVATRRFNSAFKKRRMAPDSIRPGQEIANRVNALRPGGDLMRPKGQSPEETFAQRRQQQLATWRKSNAR